MSSKLDKEAKRKAKSKIYALPAKTESIKKAFNIKENNEDIKIESSVNILVEKKSKRNRKRTLQSPENESICKIIKKKKIPEKVNGEHIKNNEKKKKNSRRKRDLPSVAQENQCSDIKEENNNESIENQVSKPVVKLNFSLSPGTSSYGSQHDSYSYLSAEKKYLGFNLNKVMESKSSPTQLDIVKDKLKDVLKTSKNDVCKILSEHSIMVLKEIVKQGIDFMKSSGRTKFLVEDFYQGLLLYNSNKTNNLCYPSSNTFSNVHYSNISLESGWLESSSPVFQVRPDIPVEQQNYFLEVTRILLKQNDDLCLSAYKHLETSSCILNLIPYFIKFLSEGIESVSDTMKITRLMIALHSLLINPHVCFLLDSNLTRITSALLQFLFLHVTNSLKHVEYWALKDYAGFLLQLVLKKSRSKTLMSFVMDEIECHFTDKYSFVSQYGALTALNSVGVIAILWLLPLHFDRYYKYLDDNYRDPHLSGKTKYEICMVKGQLIHSHYILMHHFFKYEFYEMYSYQPKLYIPAFLKGKVLPFLLQSDYIEYFGDALVNHFPLCNYVSFNAALKKQKKMNIIRLNKKKCIKINSQKNCKNIPLSREEVFEDFVPLKYSSIKFGKI